MVFKVVMFDQGGVLTGAPSMDPIENQMPADLTKHGPTDQALKTATFHPDFLQTFKSAERGEITVDKMEQLFTDFARKLFNAPDLETVQMVSFTRPYATRKGGPFMNQHIVDAIKKIREKGLKTAMLTNNFFYDEQRDLTAIFCDEALFDELFESCKIGHCKPDKGAYEYALEKLGCQASEVIFLDDFTQNVATARELGMHGIVVKNQEEAANELLALLE